MLTVYYTYTHLSGLVVLVCSSIKSLESSYSTNLNGLCSEVVPWPRYTESCLFSNLTCLSVGRTRTQLVWISSEDSCYKLLHSEKPVWVPTSAQF